MSVTSRSDEIRERLTKYLIEEIGCPVSPMPREDWDLVIDDLGPYARFGIAWPMPFDDPTGPLIVPFQADLIADVTSGLSESDLSDYLDAVEHLVELQIIRLLGKDDQASALAASEAELDQDYVGSIDLLQGTQFAALDRWARQ